MIMAPDSVRDLEEMLRGNGVTLTPLETPRDDVRELTTADGRFQAEPARVVNREEQLVTLYRTDTAEAVPTDVNEAVKRLKKRYPDKGDFALTYPQLAGRYSFTLGTRNPKTGKYEAPNPLLHTDVSGELCWLNPKSDKFSYTRSLGVHSVCRSIGLRFGLGTEQHIRSKHGGVWPLIERERAESKETREKDRFTRLIELVMEQRGIDTKRAPEVAQAVAEAEAETSAPLYVSDKPNKPKRKIRQ